MFIILMVLKNEKNYNNNKMALFNGTYCQICGRFLTKEQ